MEAVADQILWKIRAREIHGAVRARAQERESAAEKSKEKVSRKNERREKVWQRLETVKKGKRKVWREECD